MSKRSASLCLPLTEPQALFASGCVSAVNAMLLTVWWVPAGDLSEGGGAAEMISGALAEPGALAHTLREAPTLVDRGEQKQAVSLPALCSRFRLFGTFVATS